MSGKKSKNMLDELAYKAFITFYKNQNEKIFEFVKNEKVRLNVYSEPFNEVITLNGVPFFYEGKLSVFDFLNPIESIEKTIKNMHHIIYPQKETILDVIRRDKNFSILSKILRYTELEESLETENITFFAPPDKAFRKLADKLDISMEKLLDSSDLEEAIKNHILDLTIFSIAIKEGETEINSLLFNNIDSKIFIKKNQKALITKKDIITRNGVLHIIDRVLI